MIESERASERAGGPARKQEYVVVKKKKQLTFFERKNIALKTILTAVKNLSRLKFILSAQFLRLLLDQPAIVFIFNWLNLWMSPQLTLLTTFFNKIIPS